MSLQGAEPSGANRDAQSLLALLRQTKRSIDQRLAELGVTEFGEKAPAGLSAPRGNSAKVPAAVAETQPLEGLGVRACRACGQALGAAFREAQAVADAATAGILYRPLRAIERQLWVLDPLQTI